MLDRRETRTRQTPGAGVRRLAGLDPQHLGKTAEAASVAAQAAAWRLHQAEMLIEACGLGGTGQGQAAPPAAGQQAGAADGQVGAAENRAATPGNPPSTRPSTR